jgi:hypothetical protein
VLKRGKTRSLAALSAVRKSFAVPSFDPARTQFRPIVIQVIPREPVKAPAMKLLHSRLLTRSGNDHERILVPLVAKSDEPSGARPIESTSAASIDQGFPASFRPVTYPATTRGGEDVLPTPQ